MVDHHVKFLIADNIKLQLELFDSKIHHNASWLSEQKITKTSTFDIKVDKIINLVGTLP